MVTSPDSLGPWQRLGLRLECAAARGARRAHPLAVLEAIVKGIGERAGLEVPGPRAVFRWPSRRACRMAIGGGTAIDLEVMLFGADEAAAAAWAGAARSHFADGPGRNFRVVEWADPVAEVFSAGRAADLAQVLRDSAGDEVCLDFLTPLPFRTAPGRPRTWLDGPGWVAVCRERVRKLFGREPRLPAAPAVLPGLWRYEQYVHASVSQPGHHKYLNGCAGPLYLRGPGLEAWLPWLALFERIGLGGQVSFGLGRFDLRAPAPPALEGPLLDASAIRAVVRGLLDSGDDLAAALGDPAGVDAAALAERLADALRAGRPAADGPGEGIAEHVLANHVAKLLAPVLERVSAAGSPGSRRRLPAAEIEARFRELAGDGYDRVLPVALEDLFPQVPAGGAADALEAVLPRADRRLRQAVRRSLDGGAAADGPPPGLPRGNPLSPLLANLWLGGCNPLADREGLRLLRSGDDLWVAARGGEAARGLEALPWWRGPEASGPAAWQPLVGGAGPAGRPSEAATALRKPLYVTTPYARLSLHRGAAEVRHEGGAATFPLQRLEQILVLAPVTVSSALLARCAAMDVPVVLAGEPGDGATVMAGAGAARLRLAAGQARCFDALADRERLAIAAAFAAGKLENYAALVRQRWEPGAAAHVVRLERAAADIRAAGDVQAVRGLEGHAARETFRLFDRWITAPGFAWRGRRARGERPDRINVLLNLGYHLLFTRIAALLRGSGLNPYLGFLHAANGRYEALACDVEELFRANVDRFVVRLVNLGIVRAGDFRESDTGCRLDADARNRFLEQFSREMERRPAGGRPALGRAIEDQVRALVRFFSDGEPLSLYRWNPYDGD